MSRKVGNFEILSRMASENKDIMMCPDVLNMKYSEKTKGTKKERPILFSAPMVKALLEGRKTQTRRKVKTQPCHIDGVFMHHVAGPKWESGLPYRCPYGKKGDRLWVRETFAPWHRTSVEYPLEYDVLVTREQRGGLTLNEWVDFNGKPLIAYRADGEDEGWMPSIFMPRWASRITLEITDVRVQRLNEISEEDCIAEGINYDKGTMHCANYSDLKDDERIGRWLGPKGSYASLWESINGKGSWVANPWTWCLSFRKI